MTFICTAYLKTSPLSITDDVCWARQSYYMKIDKPRPEDIYRMTFDIQKKFH